MRPRLAPVRRDRLQLVRVRRRRQLARVDPGGEEPRARDGGRHVDLGPQGDDRDRRQALLRSQRRRCRRHGASRGREHPRGRDRGGRLDHHAAARPQPLHLPRADRAAQGEGGVPRDEARPRTVEGVDPDDVPEPGLLREPRVRDRGSVADVLLEAGFEAPGRRGRTAGGAHAGAVGVQPVHGSRASARTQERGAARDARYG